MRFLTVSLALTLLLHPHLRAAEKASSVQWTPFTQGVKNASAKGKYVFVDLYTDWCGYCKKLDDVTFKAAPVIAELDKHFVSIKLDAESDMPLVWKGQKTTGRDLSMQWKVEGFPTMIFLSPKGDIIGSFSSYAEPDLMLKLLTYISSGARERKVSFDDYLKGSG